MVQVIEHLLSKCKALSSNPNATKKKKKSSVKRKHQEDLNCLAGASLIR
jgi:hypothetical protein